MDEPEKTLLRKLAFLFFCALLTTSLMIILISQTSPNVSPGFDSLGSTVQEDTAQLSQSVADSLRAIAVAISHTPKFITKATTLSAIIKPPHDAAVPTIASSHIALPQVSPSPIVQTQQSAQQVTTVATAHPPPPSPPQTGNSYAWGNCTWWVAIRRAQINQPIPNSWGNAATWASRAAQDGYVVDHQPSPGAIMQTSRAAGGLGHVAFVETVEQDGTWTISEMNVIGLDAIDHASKPASAAASYAFIHGRN